MSGCHGRIQILKKGIEEGGGVVLVCVVGHRYYITQGLAVRIANCIVGGSRSMLPP